MMPPPPIHAVSVFVQGVVDDEDGLHDAGVVVVRPGVDHAQAGHANVTLASDLEHTSQIIGQGDAVSVECDRFARISRIHDLTARAT